MADGGWRDQIEYRKKSKYNYSWGGGIWKDPIAIQHQNSRIDNTR